MSQQLHMIKSEILEMKDRAEKIEVKKIDIIEEMIEIMIEEISGEMIEGKKEGMTEGKKEGMTEGMTEGTIGEIIETIVIMGE